MLSTGLAMFSLGWAVEIMIKRRIMRTSNSGAAGARGSTKLIKPYSWVAWTCAFSGALLMATVVGNPFGIHPIWATAISIAGAMFVWIDIKDGRPDLPAFFIISGLPFILRIPGGQAHTVINAIAHAVGQVVTGFGHIVGA